ncbi:MAG TPA: FAD-dependent oxidoreductase [Candidatus Lokiarchaeia archaeon]|nr:FAD-dependent oxidoreductase [Candidatus Lokiarchaeia archaeon]
MADFDVIIIGAGSIGVPTAMFVAQKGYSGLVLDKNPGPGQGMNSRAIGGIRATHSSLAKAALAQESMEIYSSWQAETGDDIGWFQGGYLFPAYSEDTAGNLRAIEGDLKERGYDVSWLDPESMETIFPWIETNELVGGLHSPSDGRGNPKLTNAAFYEECLNLGVQFNFNETVQEIVTNSHHIESTVTNVGNYSSNFVINAAGPLAKKVGEMLNVKIPITLEPHTAGRVTVSPLQSVNPLVIDLRPSSGTAMFYFFQDMEGNFVFTIDPDRPVGDPKMLAGIVAERMQMAFQDTLDVKLGDYWSGVYPMTPDGAPIIDSVPRFDNFIIAAGMGGQGFMLGPGVGALIARMISGTLTPADEEILPEFALGRNYQNSEILK